MIFMMIFVIIIIMMIFMNIMIIMNITMIFINIMLILIEYLHHQKNFFLCVCMYKMINIDKNTYENNNMEAIYYYKKEKIC